ncbi:MAG: hypothetical protein P1P84_04200 [Deferrisomatales bacterium]|nr:hypothetical protein [Deferrisomatales bacterium]
MKVAFALWLLGLAGVVGAAATVAAGVEVLAPVPGSRLSGEAVWLVLRAAESPPVFLQGEPVAPRVAEAGVHHYRLSPVTGGRGTVRIGDAMELSLGGGSAGFHETPGAACWECHDAGDGGCQECHPAPEGGKHGAVLAEGCVRCHRGPHRSAGAVQALCVSCHPTFGTGRHGNIRHAVASDRDPLRPGRAMDCASCHDPHAPRCLSCLARSELRDWCKTCHGGP